MKTKTDAELMQIAQKAWDKYKGDVSILASAIGALVLARWVGWQAIRLMHSRITFNKYERILGIKFKDEFPEQGPDAVEMRGIVMLKKLGKFWQALSGGLIQAKDAAMTVDAAKKLAGNRAR